MQEQWLKTFNLKSLDESYTPKHSDEILQALGGKEIKLQLGSLKKLVAQGREQYIPQIKEVLDSPEAIMRDDMGEYLFIKHLKDDDYFVNVSFDNGEYLVSISNGIKETNNIKNKLDFGAKVIYQSPNANSNLQTLLQASQYSANKIDNAIIPQTPQEIIKQAKQSGKSVKETKELLQKHKDIESKRKETQKLITQEKKAKENLHKEIGIFEKEKQNALEKLESIKTQINELEKKDLSSKQAQAKMTLKESIEHGNRIYSLELEELIPSINAQPHTKEAQARGS